MSYLHDYPHTSSYDGDLRQILEMYFTIKDIPAQWKAYQDLMNGKYDDLYNYVHDYFDNLDVQEEINNKIDALVADGTIERLFGRLLNEINGKINNLQTLASQKPTNVLLLGVANDGSKDISDIVNLYTKTQSLYFPAGTYRVEKPIYLVNSIYGAGYMPATDNLAIIDEYYTTFYRNFESPDILEGVFNFADNAQDCIIENINILMNSNKGSGISNRMPIKRYHNIRNVGIYGIVSGCGIYINPNTQTSKPVLINNATIMGSSAMITPGSTAIHLGNNAADCRCTDITAMGVQIGLQLDTHMSFFENTHIWTGCIVGSDKNNWWRNTRAIRLLNNAHLYATNLYLDSSVIYFTCINNGFADVNNLVVWTDSSMTGSDEYNGNIQFSSPANDNSLINIYGGRIYGSNRLLNLTNNNKVKYTDVEFRTNYELSESTNRYSLLPLMPNVKNREYKLFYTGISETRYVELFRARLNGIGVTTFTDITAVSCFSFLIYNTNDALTVTAKVRLGNFKYYYRLVNNVLQIFAEQNAGWSHNVTIDTTYNNINILYWPSAYHNDNTPFTPDILSDSTGLTLIEVETL